MSKQLEFLVTPRKERGILAFVDSLDGVLPGTRCRFTVVGRTLEADIISVDVPAKAIRFTNYEEIQAPVLKRRKGRKASEQTSAENRQDDGVTGQAIAEDSQGQGCSDSGT